MIIVDTNGIIDVMRGRTGVKQCLEKYEGQEVGISAITIQELFVGAGYIRKSRGEAMFEAEKQKIRNVLEDYTIFNITRTILESAGLKKGELRAQGITFDLQDFIIGTTAEHIAAEKVITRDHDHFKHFNVSVESYLP